MKCDQCQAELDAAALRAYSVVEDQLEPLCLECLTELTRLVLGAMEAAGLAFCVADEERTLQ